MKRTLLIFAICLLIPSVVYADKWVQVKDGKIVRWQEADSTDTLKQGKLKDHGYIPVVIESKPKYDRVTESIKSGHRIEKERVVRYYTVTDRDLTEAKQIKTDLMKQQALADIEAILNQTITVEDVEPILTKIKSILTEIADAKTNDDVKEVSYETTAISK